MKEPSIRAMVLLVVIMSVTAQVTDEIGEYIHGLTRVQHALVVGGINALLVMTTVLIVWKWTFGKWIVRK